MRLHRLICALLLAILLTAGCATPPGRILVPIYFYQGYNVGRGDRSTGLQASEDGGKTFTCITWTELITNSVAVDRSGRWLYLACGNGVMVSRDGGRNWRLTGGFEMTEVQKVAIDRRDPKRAWAATAYGVFRCADITAPGNPWEAVPGAEGIGFASDVAQDPGDPETLRIAAERGLFVGPTDGDTWRVALSNLRVRRIVHDPRDPARILVATDGRGLLEAIDGGEQFHRIAGTPDVVFAVAFDPHHAQTLYCGGMDGVSVSADGGRAWAHSSEGLAEGFFVYGILPDPERPGRILVSGNDGVFESIDGGASFSRLGFEGALVPDLARAPALTGPEAPLAAEPGALAIPGRESRFAEHRPEADPGFAARREKLRAVLSQRDPAKWPGWPKAALAVVSGPADEALWVQAREKLENPQHSMFFSMPLAGFYLHACEALPPDIAARIREIMTRSPVYRGDTENHWVMHYAALLLAAQTWPATSEAEWYAGRTTQELYEEARGWLFHWARLSATKGQGEFDSPNYFLMYLTPMLLLYDFAKEPEVRQLAGMMLDLLLADYLVESLHGAWCGGHSRIIGKEVEKTTTNRVAALHYLYAGGIAPPEKVHDWIALAALSSYRPPEVLAGVANDRDRPYVHAERKRVRNVIRLGDERNPPVAKVTWMTPQYGLGSLPGGILSPIQQHTWDVTWLGSAPNATLFTVHPSVNVRELAMFFPEEIRAITKTITAQKGVYGSPDRMVAASPYEKVLQREHRLLALYQVPSGERFPHVSLYWPDCLTRTEAGGWLFGEDGEFFLALWASEPGTWTREEGWNRFRCAAGRTGFVVVTRPTDAAGQGPTFAEFRAAFLACGPPRLEGGEAALRLSYEELNLHWGAPASSPPEHLFAGPFIQSRAGTGVIRITDGETTRTLDFNAMTIEESR